MKIKREPSRLEKKARRGQRGYPMATVAFYGPDASGASKVAVGIIPFKASEATEVRRLLSDTDDLRRDSPVTSEILAFIKEHGVMTVALSPGIIGCPHEEGIDYPDGEVCPMCPYWGHAQPVDG